MYQTGIVCTKCGVQRMTTVTLTHMLFDDSWYKCIPTTFRTVNVFRFYCSILFFFKNHKLYNLWSHCVRYPNNQFWIQMYRDVELYLCTQVPRYPGTKVRDRGGGEWSFNCTFKRTGYQRDSLHFPDKNVPGTHVPSCNCLYKVQKFPIQSRQWHWQWHMMLWCIRYSQSSRRHAYDTEK